MKTTNLGKIDITLRLAIGAAMLAVFLAEPATYNGLAALATYPILTALMAWDPVYAIVESLAGKLSHKHIATGKKKLA